MLQIQEINIENTFYTKKALIYYDTEIIPKASILYFHGGGLLYGNKNDLPDYHIRSMTTAGYMIFSFDYPLAPVSKLPEIIEDVCASINYYIKNHDKYMSKKLPYFLWGRSAGAYLCLISAGNKNLLSAPKGILSYYGYGFLYDNWFDTPNSFYNTLPHISASCLSTISDKVYAIGNLETHYSIYVYARQSGNWKNLIYEGREKFFFLDYSLRAIDNLPCPIFCTHSTGDTDVPFEEYLALCQKYNAKRHTVSSIEHDFDRHADSSITFSLLDSSITFLDECLN